MAEGSTERRSVRQLPRHYSVGNSAGMTPKPLGSNHQLLCLLCFDRGAWPAGKRIVQNSNLKMTQRMLQN